MIFHDYKFQVTRINQTYRVLEKEVLERSFHSFVDGQAIREFGEGIRYVTKYLTKTRKASQTQNLTLALCWLFRKRSFAVSGDLYQRLQASIISDLRRAIQKDLTGNEVPLNEAWVFIGIISAEKLGIRRSEWWKTITHREVLNEILASYDSEAR